MTDKKPNAKFRSGAVCATVWKNEAKTKEGQARSFFSVSFEKSYKDKDGEWKQTNSLNASDLPKAVLVLEKAYEHISLRKRQDEPAEPDLEKEKIIGEAA